MNDSTCHFSADAHALQIDARVYTARRPFCPRCHCGTLLVDVRGEVSCLACGFAGGPSAEAQAAVISDRRRS